MPRARIIRHPKLDVENERKQPRLIALLLADYAAETKEGKIVLSGVFDTIHVPRDLPRLARFFLYVRMMETNDGPVEIVLYRPDGTPHGELVIEPDEVKVDEGRVNYVQAYTQLALEIPVTGIWWFEVRYQERILGRAPIETVYRRPSDAGEDETDRVEDQT
jgi:hypothetical protein